MELQGTNYDLIYEYREAFNEEAIEEKYVDLLAKYDFLVGDWGYGQLRLKVFMMIKIKKRPLIRKYLH